MFEHWIDAYGPCHVNQRLATFVWGFARNMAIVFIIFLPSAKRCMERYWVMSILYIYKKVHDDLISLLATNLQKLNIYLYVRTRREIIKL